MIKLQPRDYDILLSLRFGIVSEEDLIDEIFNTTLIDEAPEEFQEFNDKRSLMAKQKFVAQNEHLWASIQQVFISTEERDPKLKRELIQVARKKGKHLGSQFISEIKLLEHPIEFARVKAVFNTSVALKDKSQKERNRKQMCRKVMKRLIGAKLVRSLDKLSRGGSKRYYHLTKNGKCFVQEYMHDLCLPEQRVISHNWHAMHAEHDAMVSQVSKTVFVLESKQDYKVLFFLTEDQMKGASIKEQYAFESKWGVKRPSIKYYPDLFVSLVVSNQEVKFLIEIDNATQPAKKVLGKTSRKIPMLMICSNNDRIRKLITDFIALGCKADIYFSTIAMFKVGGIFGTSFWDFQRGGWIRLPKPSL